MKRALCTFAVLVSTSGCIFSGGQTPIDPSSDTGKDAADLDFGGDATDATTPNNGVPDMTIPPDAAPGDSGTDASRDTGADAAPDMSMPDVCGDGFVTGDETCDPATSRGCPENPATDCGQSDNCLPFEVIGDPATCSSECVALPEIAVCLDGDGCCAAGCDETGDDDCAAVCGNAVQETGELCDGNCAADCSDGNSCTSDTMMGSAATCDVQCFNDPIVACVDGDGCCPSACDQSNDDDCSATCGDGVVDSPNETCDGNCPTSCAIPSDACVRTNLVGSPTNCTAECVSRTIDLCVNADGCCPPGCNANNDNDCDAVCGNGVVEPPEECDSNCAVSCNDANACTTDTATGSASTCDLICVNTAINSCVNGDGCCAPGCNANNDTDCDPVCGNNVQEFPETCDGNCVSSCDDNNSCTVDFMQGDAATCDVACTHAVTTSCISGDRCCAPGCNANNDSDCMPVCNNGVREAGEQCDGGDLGGMTCVGLGYASGTLFCNTASCTLNQSACVAPSAPQYIFATSTVLAHGLAVGSVAQADTLCNTLGRNAPAPIGGRSYVALISDAVRGVNAAQRLRWGTQVLNSNGDVVTSTPQSWPWTPLTNAVGYDENGTDASTAQAWTGSHNSGLAKSGQHCNGWTSTTSTVVGEFGNVGSKGAGNPGWLGDNGGESCYAGNNRLYCISAVERPDVRIFVTSALYDGNLGGVTGADQICRQHGNSGTVTAGMNRDWVALLSSDHSVRTVHAKDRVTWSTVNHGVRTVYNTNGQIVETASDTWGWDPENAPRFDENGVDVGTQYDAKTWTGSTEAGIASGIDCNDWTTNNSTVNGTQGRSYRDNNTWLDGIGSDNCAAQVRLYCVSR